MKINLLFSLVALVGSLLVNPASATNVGTAVIEQPVNLGTKSDPTRIPLGPVGVVCNYTYGLHRFIGEARPAPDGAMPWSGGSELDQNLASVFGISVEPEDSTQIPAYSVTIRVKPWKTPAYSPYTKDQVVAATLWCLLRRVDAPPANPLEVRVVVEGGDDMALEAKYSGKYITKSARDGEKAPGLDVPGTRLEEDARGIAWVVFPEVKKNEGFIPLAPGAIILESGGDGPAGWHVLPVWGNNSDADDFLRLNNWSSTMYYSAYKSRGVGEANTYLAKGGVDRFSYQPASITLDHPYVDQKTLDANLLALVISKQPTEAEPLTISFTVEESEIARYPAFRSAEGWQENHQIRTYSTRITLKCEFVWDAVEHKLTKGSIPLVQWGGTNWIISAQKPPASEGGGTEEKIAAAVAARIKNGINDGTLLPEKVISPDALSATGLSREITKAGYFQALATYSDATNLPKEPQGDSIRFENIQFEQNHAAGWSRGLAKCQEIVNEVRKEFDEAEVKQEQK